MRTLRLPDPFPRGKPPRKLEWGSSAWAADSCLVEWSRLEREWLEPGPAARPSASFGTWRLRDIPPSAWRWLVALATLAALGFAAWM